MAKTKSYKNLILAAIIIIVVIVVIFMWTGEKTAPVTPGPTEAPQVGEEGEIAYGSRGILSDVKCVDGKIEGIITNVQPEIMTVKPGYGSDVRIMVNGVTINDYTCDKETVAQNEYTYCSDMAGKWLKLSDLNMVSVWFSSDNKNRGTVKIPCE